MYCGKCGCEIDKDTGLCPRCDFEALKKIRDFKSKRSRKKSARMKFGWLIALILVVAIVASSVVLAVSKGWIGSSDEEESLQIRTTYITYLNSTIVPEIGVYDADRPESSNEGVYSALFSDLDDDDKDEFIVVYSSKNGDNIDFNISCYSYQSNNTVNSSDDESGVEHIGTINALSEADYTEDDNLENHLSHEIIIYSASYNDKNYIILEYLNDTTNSECSFEIHVYTIENGQFAEVSNLFVKTIFTPIFDTAFPRAVYSTKLPESLMIDDSDFDFSLLESIINYGEFWKNRFSVLEEDDSTILYFTEYGCFSYSEYVYDTYYSSDSAAVEGFLSCFGVSLPDGYITIGDDITEFPYFWLNYPDNVDFIFTYKYYQISEYGDTYYDVTITEKYEINDYTDFGSLINEEAADDSDEATDELPDEVFGNYVFSSGVGGWSTELTINSDLTFSGTYCHSSYQDPVTICEFTGNFSDVEKIDDYTFKMTLETLIPKHEEGYTYEENDIVYKCVEVPYGIDDGKEFYVYLEGRETNDLSEEFLTWVNYGYIENANEIPLSSICIRNAKYDYGFVKLDE